MKMLQPKEQIWKQLSTTA